MEDPLDPQIFWRLDDRKRFEALLGAVLNLQCEHNDLNTRLEVLEKLENERQSSG